jgi:hypothetical protein
VACALSASFEALSTTKHRTSSRTTIRDDGDSAWAAAGRALSHAPSSSQGNAGASVRSRLIQSKGVCTSEDIDAQCSIPQESTARPRIRRASKLHIRSGHPRKIGRDDTWRSPCPAPRSALVAHMYISRQSRRLSTRGHLPPWSENLCNTLRQAPTLLAMKTFSRDSGMNGSHPARLPAR